MSVSHHNNTDSSIYTNYCIFFFNLCHCQSKLKSHRQSSLVCLGFSQKRLSNEVFSARSTKSLPTTNDIPSTSNPADELSPSDVVATVTKNAQFTATATAMLPPSYAEAKDRSSKTYSFLDIDEKCTSIKSTRCCEGVFSVSNDKLLRERLLMLWRYAPHSGSQYGIRLMGTSAQPNFYSNKCTGDGNVFQNGISCVECNNLWKSHGPRMKQCIVKRRGDKFKQIRNAILAGQVTDDDILVLRAFKHTKKCDLSENGIILQEQAAAAVQFNEKAKVRIL